jgi:small conductance mechanosensitive channel
MKDLIVRHLDVFPGELLSIAKSSGRILLILVLAWIALMIVRRAIRVLRQYLSRNFTDIEAMKRAETLGQVFRYIAAVVVAIVAGTLVLGELGISVAPILGAAGVVGVAVGFGAQSLIKDYFNGFFLLLENQMRTGDVIEAGGKAGLVEDITLRYTRMRDYDGNVHFVPNGLITTVSNMSRGYAQSVIDVGVAYREDVDEVFELMRQAGAALRDDPVMGPKILEDLEIAGVEKWDDSAVVLRCRFKVRPLEQWTIRREYLRRLKRVFDERGVEIPFPHVTLYAGEGKNGSAAPLRVLQVAGGETPRAA